MPEQFIESGHFHGDGMFGSTFRSLERPRLAFRETCYRSDRSIKRVWMVDGQDLSSASEVEPALAVPPVLTAEEAAVAAQLTEHWLDREQQRALGVMILISLAQKGIAEWNRGKVRLRHGAKES